MIILKSAFQFHPLSENCHENCCSFQWIVPADLPYFEGHFINQPILPAVAIIDANLELLKVMNSQELILKQIIFSKFLAPVTPKMIITIKIQKKSDGSWFFEWTDPKMSTLTQMTLFADLPIASAAK